MMFDQAQVQVTSAFDHIQDELAKLDQQLQSTDSINGEAVPPKRAIRRTSR